MKTSPFYFGEIMTTGTKETREALKAVILIASFIIERLHDGIGVDDAVATYSKLSSDDVFKTKIKDGYEGLEQVREELKDLTTEEITTLGLEVAPDIIQLLLQLKK